MALLITTPVGFKLTASGDIDYTARRLQWAKGLDGVVQGARTRMRLVRGELFYNMDAGVPWLYRKEETSVGWAGVPRSIALLGLKFSPEKTRAALRPPILATPGVRSISRMVFAFDSATRLLEVEWTAVTIWGDTKPDLFSREL